MEYMRVAIRLRPIEESDLPLLRTWRESTHVKPFCREFRPIDSDKQKNWFYSLGEDSDDIIFIIETIDRSTSPDIYIPIGSGGLVRIDWKNRKAEISFYLAPPDYITNNNIINSLNEIIDYAFKECNLHKVYFPVYEFNPYLTIYAQVMDREYIAVKEFFRVGTYWDRIILTKFNDEKKKDTHT